MRQPSPASPAEQTMEIAVRAIEDVRTLWTENRNVRKENRLLRARIAALEACVDQLAALLQQAAPNA
jgi:hypothetical protein